MPDKPGRVAIAPLAAADQLAADTLAQAINLPALPANTSHDTLTDYAVLLVVSPEGPYLQLTGPGAPGPVGVEFGSGAMRYRRRACNNELLGRAVGVGKKPSLRVIDATAGLGRDSFVLADLGCAVTLCERHPVLQSLLESGIARARGGDDPWLAEVAGRLQLNKSDAREANDASIAAADVIYLDPMFPGREKSAAVKKDLATLQVLLGPQDDGDELLEWALSQAVARVVVKRPPRAQALAGVEPSHCISGKAVRYDVHVLRGLA